MTDDIYVIVKGSSNSEDDHIKTIEIESDGTIGDILFTADGGLGSSMCYLEIEHVSGLFYLIGEITQNGRGSSLRTIMIQPNGAISVQLSVISFDANGDSKKININHLDGNTFAVTYSSINKTAQVKTIEIDTSSFGTINAVSYTHLRAHET